RIDVEREVTRTPGARPGVRRAGEADLGVAQYRAGAVRDVERELAVEARVDVGIGVGVGIRVRIGVRIGVRVGIGVRIGVGLVVARAVAALVTGDGECGKEQASIR